MPGYHPSSPSSGAGKIIEWTRVRDVSRVWLFGSRRFESGLGRQQRRRDGAASTRFQGLTRGACSRRRPITPHRADKSCTQLAHWKEENTAWT